VEPDYIKVARECADKLRELASDVDREATYPHESMKIVRDSGLLAAVAPESMGGYDLGLKGDMWGLYRVIDILASGCSSTAQIITVHYAAMGVVKAIGSDSQMAKFADASTKGETFCFLGSEPSQRFTDTGGRIKYDSTADRVKDGWSVNARKFFATGSVGCKYMMLFTMADGAEDMTGLMTPVVDVDADGVEVVDSWDGIGQRATTSGSCSFNNVFVPDNMVIGDPGAFLKPGTIGQMFQLAFASHFVGLGQGALDFTIDYLKNKARPPHGFERAIDEPHVAHLIGDMSVKIEAGRALVRRAADALSAVERGEASPGEASCAVYQAKCHASQVSVEMGSQIFRLCGGQSASAKFNADRFWRNARTITLHDNLDRQLTATGRMVLGIADLASTTR